MMFEMRIQIFVLAATLAVSMLAGYAFAVPTAEMPANPERFAAADDPGRSAAAIFTEFGDEMAWHDKTASQ